MYKIAVFISGRGSNLNSIIHYFSINKNLVSIELVVSNTHKAYGLEIAKSNNIDTLVVNEESSYNKLISILEDKRINLIVLAGFLKKIPDILIESYENRIINIHPALLPSFGGKGMYGENVHRSVFEKSCKVSGVTIHFVNKIYDEGLIIAQEAVPIDNVTDYHEIAERVLKVEHKLLPQVIEYFAKNKIIIKHNRVYTTEQDNE